MALKVKSFLLFSDNRRFSALKHLNILDEKNFLILKIVKIVVNKFLIRTILSADVAVQLSFLLMRVSKFKFWNYAEESTFCINHYYVLEKQQTQQTKCVLIRQPFN